MCIPLATSDSLTTDFPNFISVKLTKKQLKRLKRKRHSLLIGIVGYKKLHIFMSNALINEVKIGNQNDQTP
ncbi:hypothetical protein A6J40_18095 [Legionella longbeachae]|uniref:Uncharacterized protein n=1 Tax=Legionella longbeachae serogroup 1 (strain NSW150) TaxID=661367 RepID=D3HJJ6_LEGLN|nr:hypothetical protein A6J40_18095 [Legionella longbeachae]EEZ94302.1 hypothetical protein LLB_3207 [Legionella longbeachae D-4968]CBJ12589.1 protein of unknown function [Legionella longbeachae NSW150]VEE03124.1 Uncharacterised protein [Legionella oakridgensis]ARM32885.1 hypothetical protein B0B39_04855 [Legionella longbeachae]